MDNKTIYIQKLNGTNYYLWKFKIELLLQRDKLWTSVSQDPPSPLVEEWTVKDQAAKATICLAIEDDLLINIRHCTTAKDAWITLAQLYEHPSLSTTLHLLRKLYSTRYDNYRDMKSFVNAILEIVGQLRSLKEIINDKNIIAVMLCGLPSTYNNLITAIESKEESELTIEYVKRKLFEEALRRENDDQPQDNESLAMPTTRKFPERSRTIVCYNCGKPGHTKRDCNREMPRNDSNRWTTNNQVKNNYQYQDSRNMVMSSTEKQEHPHNFSDECDECEMPKYPNARQCTCNSDVQEEYTALSGTINDKPQSWIMDSGASAHMTPDKNFFQNIVYLKTKIPITIANGNTVYAEGKGDGYITLDNDIQHNDLVKICDVLYVPTLKFQLLSIKQLCQRGHKVQFNNDKCLVESNDKIIATANLNGCTFNLTEKLNSHPNNAISCLHQWHKMGHRSNETLKRMEKQKLTNLIIKPCKHSSFCRTCQLGKMKQRPFYTSTNPVNKPFHTISTDLCGPIQESSLGGNNYILTITDKFSRYLHTEMIKVKSQASEKLINFIEMGNTKFGHYPSVLRSDGGGEFKNHYLDGYLTSRGITHQIIVPHVPQQNGLAERINSTIINITRCLLKQSNMPLKLWGEAASTATYIINRSYHASTGKTPHELWNGTKPDLKDMKTFGCRAYAFTPSSIRKKFDDTSREGYFVGYGKNVKGFRLWIPQENKIITSSKMVFDEGSYFDAKSTNGIPDDIVVNNNTINFPQTNYDNPQCEDLNCLRRSSRLNKGIPPNKLTY